jgi:serine/threonine protein kinase
LRKFLLCQVFSNLLYRQIPQREYAFYEEEYDKNTTLIYRYSLTQNLLTYSLRPPEMCDPYQKFLVNDRVDIWMLGIILYTLCFYKQPFQESSKLSIVNGAFTFPKDHSYPEKLIDVIRIMLTPNPVHRPSIYECSDIFADYFSIESIKLNVYLITR